MTLEKIITTGNRGWILVSERLPKEDEYVFIFQRWENWHEDPEPTIGYYRGGEWYNAFDCDDEGYNYYLSGVTYWQPIEWPNPPRIED